MRRWFVVIAAIGMTGAMPACSTLPDFREQDYVTLESLFYSVEQELCESLALVNSDPRVAKKLREAGVAIERQFAKATAGLELVKIVDASGNANFVIPVTNGVAGIGLNAARRHVNSVDTTVSVYYPFSELECDGEISKPPRRIEGGLGLREWVLNTTVALINVHETPAAYTYNVGFDVITDGRARPSFAVSTSSFRTIGGEISIGGARQSSQTINVTIKDVAVDDGIGGGRGVPNNVRDALDREEGLAILRRINE